VSRGEPLVIALARSFLFAEKKIFHIPPDLVVDQWAFDGESSSHRPSLLQDDVWTMLCPRISEKITLALSIAWHFTTKSGCAVKAQWRNVARPERMQVRSEPLELSILDHFKM